MSLAAPIQITDQDARSVSSVKQSQRLGQIARTHDGRTYAWALNGAVDLAAGKLTQAAAVVANDINRTGVAYAIGVTQVSFTVGAATTADKYADGYFAVSVGPGQNLYRVTGNTAGTSPVVNLEEPLTIATTTSSKFGLYKHPQDSVVISAGAVAASAVGVPNVAVTAAYYFWNQIGGPCAVLSDGVIGLGSGAIISDAVNGAVEVEVAGTVTQRVGYAHVAATVDAEYRPICLNLAGSAL